MRLCFVGLAMIGLMQTASAGELSLPWLRGAADLGPGTPNAAPALPGQPVSLDQADPCRGMYPAPLWQSGQVRDTRSPTDS